MIRMRPVRVTREGCMTGATRFALLAALGVLSVDHASAQSVGGSSAGNFGGAIRSPSITLNPGAGGIVVRPVPLQDFDILQTPEGGINITQRPRITTQPSLPP